MNNLRKWGKKLILEIAKLLFFRIKYNYQKYAHHITQHYYRWLLDNRLETRGNFYISSKANLNIEFKGARLIINNLLIKDFTQITLESDQAYMETGKDVVINRFCNFIVWNGRLLIGNNVLFNNYCSISCMELIEIGNDTWFGEGVRFYDHNHHYKMKGIPFTQQGITTGKIKIGNNCWIGCNTVILQNVTIGDNCVIGANNLIYKSVPDNSIVKAKAMELISPIEYD